MKSCSRFVLLLSFVALAPDKFATSFQHESLQTVVAGRAFFHRSKLQQCPLTPYAHGITTFGPSSQFRKRPRCADVLTRRYRNSRESEFEATYNYRGKFASNDPNVSGGALTVIREKFRRALFMLSQFIFRLKKLIRYAIEKHTIYVLECESGKFYVGSTSHRRQRRRQHFESNRGGSAFTRLYRPIRVHAEYRRIPQRYYLGMEAKITAQQMLLHGINNVRGAMFSETRNYTMADIDSLTAFLGHFNDLSYAHVRSTLKESLPSAAVADGENAAAAKRRKRKRARMRKKEKMKTTRKGRCFRCGKEGHYSYECPETIVLDNDDDEEEAEGGITMIGFEGVDISDTD